MDTWSLRLFLLSASATLRILDRLLIDDTSFALTIHYNYLIPQAKTYDYYYICVLESILHLSQA